MSSSESSQFSETIDINLISSTGLLGIEPYKLNLSALNGQTVYIISSLSNFFTLLWSHVEFLMFISCPQLCLYIYIYNMFNFNFIWYIVLRLMANANIVFILYGRCTRPLHIWWLFLVSIMQLGKISREEIEKELVSVGVSLDAVKGLVEVLSFKSLTRLEGLVIYSWF